MSKKTTEKKDIHEKCNSQIIGLKEQVNVLTQTKLDLEEALKKQNMFKKATEVDNDKDELLIKINELEKHFEMFTTEIEIDGKNYNILVDPLNKKVVYRLFG